MTADRLAKRVAYILFGRQRWGIWFGLAVGWALRRVIYA